MKSINTKYEDQGKYTSKIIKNKAFTLVELIIVITILAILATIAFVSFKNYAGNARDGNKLTTLSNIEKGLSLYQIKTGSYPAPDSVYGSGSYSGALLSQVGLVGSGVVQSINMNKTPKDPIVDFEYTYGLSNNKKYYQLGAVLENNETTFIPQTYVNNYTSKVIGNYKGLYRFSTGGLNYIMNLPSLIFTQSGAQDFGELSNNPKFVINNGGNLVKPYDEGNQEEVNTVLEKLTQTGGITLKTETVPTDWNSGSGTLAQELGYPVDNIGHEIFGEKYYTDRNNLQPPTPAPVVTASVMAQSLCTANGQIIYADASGGEIGRVNNAGTTTSGNPLNLTITGHIVVCTGNQAGYVLKSVNEGATAVGAIATTTAYGNYYQFGKTDTSWINGNSSYSYDWKASGGTDGGSANDWGVTNTTRTTATYANSTEANKIKMKGPCPTNYHVPTNKEWNDVYSAWGGGSSAGTALSNALKLPLAGYRNDSDGSMYHQGSYGYYWSSSPGSTTGYYLGFSSSNVHPSYNAERANGFSVRCFKD